MGDNLPGFCRRHRVVLDLDGAAFDGALPVKADLDVLGHVHQDGGEGRILERLEQQDAYIGALKIETILRNLSAARFRVEQRRPLGLARGRPAGSCSAPWSVLTSSFPSPWLSTRKPARRAGMGCDRGMAGLVHRRLGFLRPVGGYCSTKRSGRQGCGADLGDGRLGLAFSGHWGYNLG
jgi:hypothetical protein